MPTVSRFAEIENDDGQIAFERAAIEAAQGYLRMLDELYDALQREEKLKRQLAALVGIEDPRL